MIPVAVLVAGGVLAYTLIQPQRALDQNAVQSQGDAERCSGVVREVAGHLARGKVREARVEWDRAPAGCENDATWWGAEAELLVLEGQAASAQSLAERALAKNPKLLSARRAQCLVYSRAAEHGRAKACFKRLLDEHPTDLGSVFGAAMASQSANHYHGAREGFLKALRLEPKHAEARYRLAQMTLAIGAKAEAGNHLRKLRQIVTPEDPRVRDIEQRLAARATSDKPASQMK